ncbi:MAG: hypothetical protein ABFS86_16660 [Planctomycetota bacterium]
MRVVGTSLVVALLLCACAAETPAPPADPVPVEPAPEAAEPALKPGEAVCVILPPDPDSKRRGWESFSAEVRCGGPGRVEVLWGDRVEFVKGEPVGTSLAYSSGVSEPTTVHLELSFKFIPGEDVLTQYVKPVGGEKAVAAVRDAVPGFAKSTLGLLHIRSRTKNGWSEMGGPVSRKSVPPRGASSATTAHSVGAQVPLPLGRYVLLWQRAWSDTTGVSTVHEIGRERARLIVNGKEIVPGDYNCPVWSFQIRFSPPE